MEQKKNRRKRKSLTMMEEEVINRIEVGMEREAAEQFLSMQVASKNERQALNESVEVFDEEVRVAVNIKRELKDSFKNFIESRKYRIIRFHIFPIFC